MNQEAEADLKRWRKKALKRGADCSFESDYIPEDVARQVKAMLDGAATEDEIKAAFDVDDTRAYADAMIAQIHEWYGSTDDVQQLGDSDFPRLAIKKKSHLAEPK